MAGPLQHAGLGSTTTITTNTVPQSAAPGAAVAGGWVVLACGLGAADSSLACNLARKGNACPVVQPMVVSALQSSGQPWPELSHSWDVRCVYFIIQQWKQEPNGGQVGR